MAKTSADSSGAIVLPAEWGTAEAIVERRDQSLLVLPVRRDLRRIYIEATARCNLDCRICVRRTWRDAPGEMSMETFDSLAGQLRDFPDLREVTFGGFGEPLLHPHIVEMVARASGLGARVALTTNGLALERAMAEALIGARLGTLVVSVDTAHVQAYAQAGVTGGLDRVLSNVRTARALVEKRGLMTPRIGLEVVATRSNLEDLVQLPSLAREVGASFVQVSNLLPYRSEEARDVLYDRDGPLAPQTGWPVASGGWVVWGIARLPRMKWGASRKCRFVESRALVVGWDGAVSPCYALMHTYPYFIYGRRKEVTRYTLGNVNAEPLDRIWTSEEYVLFRAKVSDFRFPSCVDCGMACAYAEANQDCWGNSPSCADCLWAQDIVQCP